VPDGVVLRVERVPDPRGDVALVGVEVPEAVGVEGEKLVGDDEVDSDALADPVREEHAGGDTPAEEVEPARTGDVRQRIASGSVGTSWPMTTNWRIRGVAPTLINDPAQAGP